MILREFKTFMASKSSDKADGTEPCTIDMTKIIHVVKGRSEGVEGLACLQLSNGEFMVIDMEYETFVNIWRADVSSIK